MYGKIFLFSKSWVMNGMVETYWLLIVSIIGTIAIAAVWLYFWVKRDDHKCRNAMLQNELEQAKKDLLNRNNAASASAEEVRILKERLQNSLKETASLKETLKKRESTECGKKSEREEEEKKERPSGLILPVKNTECPVERKNIKVRLREGNESVLDEIINRLNIFGAVEIRYLIREDELNRVYLEYVSKEHGICDTYFVSEKFYDELFCHIIRLRSKGRTFTEGTACITDACKEDTFISFTIDLYVPWREYTLVDNLDSANKEAGHIVRSARQRAIEERRRIIKQAADDCISMQAKAQDAIREEYRKIDNKKKRLEDFLSLISEKEHTDRSELLHDLCIYMDYEQETRIIYPGDEIYRERIREVKRVISRTRKDGWDISSKERPQHIPYGLWEETKSLFGDFMYDILSIYISEVSQIGHTKAYMKIAGFIDNLNAILDKFGLEVWEPYAKNWTDLIYEIENLKNFKEQKKAELREEAEREREERKAQREYERAIRQAEKDEATARRKIEEVQKKLEEQKKDERKYKELTEQIEKLQQALQDAIQRGERALSMAQQTKKGFVYIISNKGSFGENVYKIGLTRRLDPTERVDELSNASVPFPFSIYTIIESDDAPALEAHLHRKFEGQKINKTNWRKEFFRISKEDIDRALEEENISVMDKERYA